MRNQKSTSQDFKSPATPKNMAPDQAQLYRSLQAIELGKGQRTGNLQGANPQDRFATRGPEAHPPGTAGPGAGTSYDYA
jgi:hypothetical protein